MANRSLKEIQRAFVTFAKVLPAAHGPITVDTFSFRQIMVNSGTTPAKKMRSWQEYQEVAPEGMHSFVTKSERPPYAVIGPHTSQSVGEYHIPTEVILRAARNETWLLFWVKVEYEDIFGKHHETVASYRIVPRFDHVNQLRQIPPEHWFAFEQYGMNDVT